MLPNKLILAGALGLAMAAPLAAEQIAATEHVIVLTGFSYFPAVTYAHPGDTIRFVNESGGFETVVGKDAGWYIGPLANAEQATLVVTEDTELAFFSAYGLCTQGQGGGTCGNGQDSTDAGTFEGAAVKAEISFATPALTD